jgi:hypothetical protein
VTAHDRERAAHTPQLPWSDDNIASKVYAVTGQEIREHSRHLLQESLSRALAFTAPLDRAQYIRSSVLPLREHLISRLARWREPRCLAAMERTSRQGLYQNRTYYDVLFLPVTTSNPRTSNPRTSATALYSAWVEVPLPSLTSTGHQTAWCSPYEYRLTEHACPGQWA